MDDDKQNGFTQPERPAEPQVPPAAPRPAAPPHAAFAPEAPHPVTQIQPPRRPRSIIGPLVLILLGIGFLLSNLGLVTWNIWELMFRLWPLWLVAAGIDLLFGRSRWGSWVAVGLLLALIGGAGWFAPAAWSPMSGQAAQSDSFSQPLGTARRAEINIHNSVGQLIIRDSGDASVLAEGQINGRPGERISREHSLNGDTARYDIESRDQGFNPNMIFGGDRSSGLWDIALNTQVPLSLNIGTGVGKADIDLSRLQVTDLRVETGVGAADIRLPTQQGQLRARIDSGVGAVTIRLPRGMAARITAENGIGNVSVPAGYDRQGSLWVTPNYDSAQSRVQLDVHGGVGAIRIEALN